MINNMSQGLGSFNNMMPQNNMMQQNPYGQQMGQQMNPQMGQQMRSPEMFSEQLMAPNQMNPMQDPMQGLQPMAEPEGFGVYGQSLEGFADGGAASSGGVPRETMIGGQPHMLAYINPEEEQMLYNAGGSGEPGPGGIPAYYHAAGHGEGSNRRWNEQNAPAPVQATDAYGIALPTNESRSAEKAYQAANAAAISRNVTPFASTTERGGGTGVFRGGVEGVRQRDSKADRVAKTAADARAYAASRRVTEPPFTGTPPEQKNQSERLAEYKKNTPNSFREFLANLLTPGDNMEYVNGQLVYGDNDKSVGMPVSPEERNSFNLKVGLGNSAGNDNPGESTYANYEEARAGNKSGLPGLPGAAASSLGGIMAFAGGIRGTDLAVGRGANGEQIFEAKNGTFYVIDRSTGLVRNVQGKNDSSNNQADIASQQQSLEDMMADASSNNSPEELAYVAAIQAEQDAINNPVIASSYSPTALTRAGIGGGSNVGSFYDTTPNVVM